MYAMLKSELKALFSFIHRNWNEVAVISLSTLFFILAKYNPIGNHWQSSAIYYGLCPLLSILIVLRRNPLDFGLRLGKVKIWGFHLLIALPVIFLLIWWGTSTKAVERYYTSGHFDLSTLLLGGIVVLIPWEFIFRGFMLFGLKDKLKEYAILVQMIPFALLHINKPEAETISCIFSGIYFGYICYRTGSYWPSVIIHYFIWVMTKLLVVY